VKIAGDDGQVASEILPLRPTLQAPRSAGGSSNILDDLLHAYAERRSGFLNTS